MKRRTWLVLGTCLTAVVAAFYWGLYKPFQRHRDFCEATRADLDLLTKKRPPNLTRTQWNNIVGWTINGHQDILCARRGTLRGVWGISRAEMSGFEAELRRRLNGTVDLTTIDWIWDEYERLVPDLGAVYSPRWRPTSPEKLREFEENGGIWLGIEVD